MKKKLNENAILQRMTREECSSGLPEVLKHHIIKRVSQNEVFWYKRAILIKIFIRFFQKDCLKMTVLLVRLAINKNFYVKYYNHLL